MPPSSTLPRPGSTPGSAVLDGPPPSPATSQGMSPGTPLGSLVPSVPSSALPPEVLTGMMQAAEKISTIYDGFAQATPDLAADWAMAKQALEMAMAKVLAAGAGATSPNNPGPQFPGGGFDKGGMPSASGGV